MKKVFSKTWFQIIFFGIVIGAVLILIDGQYHLWSAKKNEEGTYNGPVTVDKSKTYFTQAALNETSFDFGKVKEGDTVSHVFTITNNGDEPLVVYKAAASCECVAGVVTKEMIAPGKTENITTYFDTRGRKGAQNRTITLTCNTDPADMVITLKADVE